MLSNDANTLPSDRTFRMTIPAKDKAQNIRLTRLTPSTSASISSLVLYMANEARTAPCMP